MSHQERIAFRASISILSLAPALVLALFLFYRCIPHTHDNFSLPFWAKFFAYQDSMGHIEARLSYFFMIQSLSLLLAYRLSPKVLLFLDRLSAQFKKIFYPCSFF